MLLEDRMQSYGPLSNAQLVVNQSGKSNGIENELKYLEALRSRDSLVLANKDELIDSLRRRVTALSKIEKDLIPFEEINREVRINYPNLSDFSYSVTLVANEGLIDTLNTFNSTWKDGVRSNQIDADKERLRAFLKVRLRLDTLILR
jgi:hypothetical protein